MIYLLQAEEQEISFDLLQQLAAARVAKGFAAAPGLRAYYAVVLATKAGSHGRRRHSGRVNITRDGAGCYLVFAGSPSG
jgi:hypothetical protein